MAVANNADDYAAPRLNYFFPGVRPSLDGQCVSLEKWFLQEMTNVPDPQAARGHGRQVGRTLVNQGHAREVPYADRKRGDIVCYEQGEYGHVGIILSGNRTFEQNVTWPGVASKIVAGNRVYASRIGSMDEAWRHKRNMHIYRVNTYKESSDMSTVGEVEFNYLYIAYFGPMSLNPPTDGDRKRWIGAETNTVIRQMREDPRYAAYNKYVSDLEKAVQNPSIPTPKVYMPYSGPTLYTEKQQ